VTWCRGMEVYWNVYGTGRHGKRIALGALSFQALGAYWTVTGSCLWQRAFEALGRARHGTVRYEIRTGESGVLI